MVLQLKRYFIFIKHIKLTIVNGVEAKKVPYFDG